MGWKPASVTFSRHIYDGSARGPARARAVAIGESKQIVMSAILDGEAAASPPGALLDPDVESTLEEKNQLISRQYAEIERLQRELAEVVGERDALLCEVSKFKFEREMTDLKRLHDDRYVLPFFNPLICERRFR